MNREHEEMMRQDFAHYVDLNDQAYIALHDPASQDHRIADLYRQQAEVDERWKGGPHAEHWGYLHDARDDFKSAPDTMARMVENIDHNDGFGVSEIQRRSLAQAGALVTRSAARIAAAREQRGPIERSR